MAKYHAGRDPVQRKEQETAARKRLATGLPYDANACGMHRDLLKRLHDKETATAEANHEVPISPKLKRRGYPIISLTALLPICYKCSREALDIPIGTVPAGTDLPDTDQCCCAAHVVRSAYWYCELELIEAQKHFENTHRPDSLFQGVRVLHCRCGTRVTSSPINPGHEGARQCAACLGIVTVPFRNMKGHAVDFQSYTTNVRGWLIDDPEIGSLVYFANGAGPAPAPASNSGESTLEGGRHPNGTAQGQKQPTTDLEQTTSNAAAPQSTHTGDLEADVTRTRAQSDQGEAAVMPTNPVSRVQARGADIFNTIDQTNQKSINRHARQASTGSGKRSCGQTVLMQTSAVQSDSVQRIGSKPESALFDEQAQIDGRSSHKQSDSLHSVDARDRPTDKSNEVFTAANGWGTFDDGEVDQRPSTFVDLVPVFTHEQCVLLQAWGFNCGVGSMSRSAPYSPSQRLQKLLEKNKDFMIPFAKVPVHDIMSSCGFHDAEVVVMTKDLDDGYGEDGESIAAAEKLLDLVGLGLAEVLK